MSEALYRKYRPQVFEDVVGQEHIERTIKNAIERDKVSHAYLFTGPRGTGKTTTARLLAKALLCQKGPTPEPDGTCEDCELIASGEHPDVYELDAASRTGVENVREEIIGRVQFAPTRGRYKIYIIDEVHMLSTAAFNALLKTLEEPPSHVVFILATTDPQKVPETIHSRCQRFDFRRISNDSIVSRLGAICVSEGVEFEGEALELIAHRAEGGMRNALTSLEQLIAFGEGRVTMDVAERMLGALDSSDLAEIVRFVGTRDVASCFKWTAEYVETGADLAQFTRDFAEHIRNLYVMSLAGADVALEVTDAARREMAEELPLFGPDRLARLLGVLGDLSAELKTSTNPRLSFEIALTRMVRPESDLTLEGLAARIEALEASGHAGFAGMAAQADAAPFRGAQPSREPVLQQPVSQPVAAQPVVAQPARESVAQPRAEHVQQTRPAEAAAQVAASPVEQVRAAAPAANVASAGSGLSDQLVSQMQNPAALQRLWQTVLASLKKAKTAYGVLFLNTKAVFDGAAGCLVIEFPEENEFAFKAVQKPDVQDELAKCLAAACGAPLPFMMRKGSSGSVCQGGAVNAGAEASRNAAAAQPLGGARAESRPAAEAAQASSAVAASAEPVARVAQAEPRSTSASRTEYGTAPVSAGASAQEYEYDGPPIDSYDDYVPYDDVYEAAPVSAPWSQPSRQPEPQPVPVQQQPAAQRVQAPKSDDVPPWEAYSSGSAAASAEAVPSASNGATGDPSPSDLDAVLAFGFGEGLSFTEV